MTSNRNDPQRPVIDNNMPKGIDRSDTVPMMVSSIPSHPANDQNARSNQQAKKMVDRPSHSSHNPYSEPRHLRVQRRYALILAPHVDRLYPFSNNTTDADTERQYLALVNPLLLQRIDTAATYVLTQRPELHCGDTAADHAALLDLIIARVAKTAQRAAERRARRGSGPVNY